METIHGENVPTELLEFQSRIWNYSLTFINSMSLKWAIELGIPDIIHKNGQPMSLSDLVSAIPIHSTKSQYVPRLMALLVHSGFFQVTENDDPAQQAYSLTPASSLLVKDSPYCATPIASCLLDPILVQPWLHLTTWFQNDDSSIFRTLHGEEFYEKCRKDPGLDRLLNELTASDSLLISKAVVSKCRQVFEGLKSLVDVGGGKGIMSTAIAEAFPELDCTVLDQPHVVAGLQGRDNLKYVGGNMFESVPPADAALLKLVLLDWNDENCIKILKRCKEAISGQGRGGKLIIVEQVMGYTKLKKESVETQLLMDMVAMGCVDGKERSETEWANLFYAAGFSSYKIYPVLDIRALIEVYP